MSFSQSGTQSPPCKYLAHHKPEILTIVAVVIGYVKAECAPVREDKTESALQIAAALQAVCNQQLQDD